MKLVRRIANLGYGSRKQVALMFREGRITDAAGDVLYADDKRAHADIRIDGQSVTVSSLACPLAGVSRQSGALARITQMIIALLNKCRNF